MNIYNVIILDESGSMTAIYDQALSGINEVLSGIRKNHEEFPDQQHYVTIVTFDGNGIGGVKTRRDRIAIEKEEDLTWKDYRPGGCTPLYDALGKTFNTLEAQIHEDDRVMATIITDGYPDFGEDSPNLSFDSQIAKKRR